MRYIQYAVGDRIALITLNRPDKLNALTYEMAQEIRQAFDLAERDDL